MRIGSILLLLLSGLICAACDPFWAAKQERVFRESGWIDIGHLAQNDEFHPNGGFYIRMQPDLAVKLHVTEREEFLKFLDARLKIDEQAMGHTYCQFGYMLSPMYYYHGIFAELSGICLAEPTQDQITI